MDEKTEFLACAKESVAALAATHELDDLPRLIDVARSALESLIRVKERELKPVGAEEINPISSAERLAELEAAAAD